MAAISAIGVDSYAVLSGGTVSTVTSATASPAATASATGSSTTTSSAAAAQNNSLIEKASANAGKVLEAVNTLRQDLASASQSGTSLGADQITQLNQRIASVRDQVNAFNQAAQVGGANLLSGATSSVTVTSVAGDKVKVANQQLDSKSLGLDDLTITDAQSLRQAAGQVALATGQAQRIDYNLQVAKSVITPTNRNPGLEAFSQILAAQTSGPAAGSALASVETAISSQVKVNAQGYNSSGSFFASTAKSRTNSILDLFG